MSPLFIVELLLIVGLLFAALPMSIIAHESSTTTTEEEVDRGQGVGTTTITTTEPARDADGNIVFIDVKDPDTGEITKEVLYVTTTQTVTYTYTWYSVKKTINSYHATHSSDDPNHDEGWWSRTIRVIKFIIPFL